MFAMRRLIGDRRIRFLVVGGYNTGFGYLVFALAYWALGDRMHYVFIATIAHFLAVTNSFLTQRHLVFRSRNPWRSEFFRFQLTYLGMLPVGVALLAFFYDLLGFPMLVAQALGMVTVVFVSYFVISRFTFRQ